MCHFCSFNHAGLKEELDLETPAYQGLSLVTLTAAEFLHFEHILWNPRGERTRSHFGKAIGLPHILLVGLEFFKLNLPVALVLLDKVLQLACFGIDRRDLAFRLRGLLGGCGFGGSGEAEAAGRFAAILLYLVGLSFPDLLRSIHCICTLFQFPCSVAQCLVLGCNAVGP